MSNKLVIKWTSRKSGLEYIMKALSIFLEISLVRLHLHWLAKMDTKALSNCSWIIQKETSIWMQDVLVEWLHLCMLALMDTKMLFNCSWTIPKELIWMQEIMTNGLHLCGQDVRKMLFNYFFGIGTYKYHRYQYLLMICFDIKKGQF